MKHINLAKQGTPTRTLHHQWPATNDVGPTLKQNRDNGSCLLGRQASKQDNLHDAVPMLVQRYDH